MSRTTRKFLTHGNYREARKGRPEQPVGQRIQVERPIWAKIEQPERPDNPMDDLEAWRAYLNWLSDGCRYSEIVGYETVWVTRWTGEYVKRDQGRDAAREWRYSGKTSGGMLMSRRNTHAWDREANDPAYRRQCKVRERAAWRREVREWMSDFGQEDPDVVDTIWAYDQESDDWYGDYLSELYDYDPWADISNDNPWGDDPYYDDMDPTASPSYEPYEWEY